MLWKDLGCIAQSHWSLTDLGVQVEAGSGQLSLSMPVLLY